MFKYLFLYSNKETTKENATDNTKSASITTFNNKLINLNFVCRFH